jgi:glutaredoxin
MATEYIVFTKDNCKWCTIAKNLLTENKLKFIELNIDENETALMLSTFLRFRTMPQVIRSDLTLMGGSEQLEKYLTFNGYKGKTNG